MRSLSRQHGIKCAAVLIALLSAFTAGCGGGGDSSPKEYTLAGRVVNGNPYHNITEPRPGTKVLIDRSYKTVILPSGPEERYQPYTEAIADANGNFSLRVPAGIYFLTTVPPPGGNPNDGIGTPDDVCASHEVIKLPVTEETAEGDGQHLILGHDFCDALPVTD